MIFAQVPLAEIEGRLSIYLPQDTTSVHIGKNAGESQDLTSPRYNTFLGMQAGKNNSTGSSNSFFGANAGFSNETASWNSFFGYYSGQANTTGSSNSFFGFWAGFENDTGFLNSFFGDSAGRENRSGFFNNFYGVRSGENNESGNGNNFFGTQAGRLNSTGSKNNYIGSNAGTYMNGDGNVIIGDSTAWRVTGSGNIFIGYNAGPNPLSAMNTTTLDNRLYINNHDSPDPLIYGEFDSDYIKINGSGDYADVLRIGTNSSSPSYPDFGEGMELVYNTSSNLGQIQVYDRDNSTWGKLHLGDGNVGIGTIDPLNDLEIEGDAAGGVAGFTRSDIVGGAKSHVLFGNNGDWYIRPSLSSGKIVIADNGGNVGIGTSTPESTLEVNGKINVGDDNQTDQAGDIRYNASNQDFEGFDGTAWLSLTGKTKVHTLNIGAGEIMIDTDDQEDFNISHANGYTTFTSSFGQDGRMYCPLQLPVGSKIIEVTYNYVDNNPDDEISFELREYNEDSNGTTSFYPYTTSNLSLSGFETHSITSDLTLGVNNYYAFIFTLRRTGGSAYDSQKIQGVQVKYLLP